MDTSGSLLRTFVKRVRFLADEPSDDALYTDDDVINHFFAPAYSDVWSRLNMGSQGRVLLRHELTVTTGVEFYDLPPNIGRVIRLSRIDTGGEVYDDLVPRSEFSPLGPGWSIQGNTLAIRPFPIGTGTVVVWYIPSGSVQAHFSITGGLYATDTTNKTFTLGTPTLGQLDRRVNGYAGQMLRVLGASVHQERIIESHDPSTGRVVLRRPLDPVPATSNVTYEIAPLVDESFMQAISLRGAMLMLAMKRGGGGQRAALEQEYRAAMKSVLDNASYVQARQRTTYQKGTVDNRDIREMGFMSS